MTRRCPCCGKGLSKSAGREAVQRWHDRRREHVVRNGRRCRLPDPSSKVLPDASRRARDDASSDVEPDASE